MTTPYYTDLSPVVNEFTVCGKTFQTWHEAGWFYIKSLVTGNVKKFKYSENLNDWFAALCWRLRLKAWVGSWMLRLLAALRLPTPPTTPTPTAPASMPVEFFPESECQSFGLHHWNLPLIEQDAPAVAYRGTKRLCEHCASQYDRSMALVAKREAEARTVARVAACDEGTEKEHIVKVDATKPEFEVGQSVVWAYENNRGWGWQGNVAATITKIGRKRIQIAAELQKGGTKLVWVTPEKLTIKETQVA